VAVKCTLPTDAGVSTRFDPLPDVWIVPLLVTVVTVSVLPAIENVSPAVIFKVDAVTAPCAVNVAVPLFNVNVPYVAAGILLVAVNVKLPLDALGMDTAPLDTVTVPLLVNVVDTVKSWVLMANVPPLTRVAAVIFPCAVPPSFKVNTLYVFAGRLVALFVNVILPTDAGVSTRFDPLPVVVMVPLLVKVVTVRVLPTMANVSPAVMFKVDAVTAPCAVNVAVPLFNVNVP